MSGRGHVPKVHMIRKNQPEYLFHSRPGAVLVECGRSTWYPEHRTDNWGKVTCTTCKNRKGKQ